MATDHSVNRTWKYLSFALIGILAAGSTVSFMPQASAHITTNVQHMLEHIYSFVDGIEAKTNNLPADPASNTVVNTRASQDSVNTLQIIANDTGTKVTNIETIVGGFGSGTGNNLPTCVTIDVNRDNTIDIYEISPRPHMAVNYEGCDLASANLSHADLILAYLSNTNLSHATLSNANLRQANLSHANLVAANLIQTDLSDAKLSNAFAVGARLYDANLSNANLSNADLSHAKLSNTNLSNANLSNAKLTGADFTGCIGDPVGTPADGAPLPTCGPVP